VLIAEDNPVNQRLLSELLRRSGHEVVLVESGREAVGAALANQFDLILMDVQMPGMDGIEAARLIRLDESVTGERRPIIALTACAMIGDKEKCIAAGMDGYLSKPISPAQLVKTLEETQLRLRGNRPVCTSPRQTDPVNREALIADLGEDPELMAEVAGLFIQHAPVLVADLRDAVLRGDHEGAERSAHSLVGSAGHFHATAVVEAASQLEAIARRGNLSGAEDAIRSLETEIGRLAAVLTQLTAEIHA
jgi:CheY-like chemotaxis protein